MIAPSRALGALACTIVIAAVACEKAERSSPAALADQSVVTQSAAAPPVAPGRAAVGDAFGTGAGGKGMVGDVSGIATRAPSPRPGRPGSRTESNLEASAADATPEPAQPGSRAAIDTTSAVTTAMLIRTGTAVVQVDSLERAIAAVQELARRFGGYVANTNLSVGDNQVRRADLELKLPAARFDEATNAVRPLGKVEGLSITTEDVGEEFVDMSARMNNARRLEERLIDLLARRTGKLEDMLAVERELARVREEIERYEGHLRFLRSRAAMSTLTITVHEPAPVFAPRPGPSRIGEAFRDAWRNFVGFLAALIASLGWLVPLVAVVGAIVWAGRRFIPRPAPAPAPSPRPTPVAPVPERRDAA